MKKLLFLLLVVVLTIPGFAAADDFDGGVLRIMGTSDTGYTYTSEITDSTYTFTAPDGWSIAGIELWVMPGTSCNYTMYTDLYSVSGWLAYEETGVLNSTGSNFRTAIEGHNSLSSVSAPGFHYPEIFGFGPGFEYTGDALDHVVQSQGFYAYAPFYQYSCSYIRDPDRYSYTVASPVLPVRTITITNYEPPGSEYPVEIFTVTDDRFQLAVDSKQPGASYDFNEEYGGGNPLDILEQIYGFLGTLVFLLTFLEYIFIEHFFELFVLYEIILAAYAASQSRDFMIFCKKFTRANKKLFEFIFKFMETIVNIITRIINVFKPI